MTNQKDTLENFLRWFLDLEEISVEAKKEFTGHLLEVGGFDDVAATYVDVVMSYLIETSSEQAKRAKEQLDAVQAAIEVEKNPETSLRVKSVREATDKMKDLAQSFKAKLYREEQKKEKGEAAQEQVELDTLKDRLK